MKKLLLLIALLSQPLTAATSLTFSGQGYITQGGEYHYNTTNSDFRLNVNYGTTDDITFSFITPEYVHWWYISFRAANGDRLQVGMYNNAVRWHGGDNSKPSFSIVGDGRGSNTITGWFNILEIEWNPEHNELLKFAATFHQLSEGRPESYTDGTILYNSTVPEMSSLGLVLLSIPALLRRTRR